MTLTALLTLAAMQAMIAASPGPAFVLTVRIAALRGTNASIWLAFGLAAAIAIWAASALAGLALVFHVAPWLETGLRIAGGIFLIWIGYSLWRHARDPLPVVDETIRRAKSPRGIADFGLGLATNLGNPKALAYFTAVFSGLVPAAPSLQLATLIVGVVFAMEFAWYAGVALVFSGAPARRVYARVKTRAERLLGGLLAVIGLRLAATP